jgi:hypothetical protein
MQLVSIDIDNKNIDERENIEEGNENWDSLIKIDHIASLSIK